MRVISVKGKHIMISGVVFILTVIILYLSAPEIMMHHALRLNNKGMQEEARVIYDRVVKYFPHSSQAASALYHSAGYDTPSYYNGLEERDLVYVFPTFTSSHGTRGIKKIPQRAVDKYTMLIDKYPQSTWSVHALKELAVTYFSLEDYESTEHCLKEYIGSARSPAEGYHMLAELYRIQGRTEEALRTIETCQGEYPKHLSLEISLLKGEILVDLERYDEAADITAQLPDMARSLYEDLCADLGMEVYTDNVNNWEDKANRLLASLEAKRNNFLLTGTVSGRITKGPAPFPDVYVYLQNKTRDNTSVSPPEYLAKTKTGPDGSFLFDGLSPGEYQIGLGVPGNRIAGYTLEKRDAMSSIALPEGATEAMNLRFVKTLEVLYPTGGIHLNQDSLTFSWEEVEGAKEYTLYAGPITTDNKDTITSIKYVPLISGITANSVTVRLEDYDLMKPLTVSFDENGVSPDVILGLLYPGGKFTWGVTAFDEKGSELTRSRDYRYLASETDLPLFSISGEIINKGDRLLLEGRYPESIQAYENILKEDPGNIHSLSALARLNHYGFNKTAADYRKAADYYRSILEIKDAPGIRESLAEVLFKSGDYEESYMHYRKVQEVDDNSWLIHYKMGQCLFLLGKAEDAFNCFDSAAQMDNGKYMRGYPIAAALVSNRVSKAVEYSGIVHEGAAYTGMLKEYRDRGFSVGTDIFILIEEGSLDRAMQTLDPNDTFHLFIRGLIQIIQSNYSEAQDTLNRLKLVASPEADILTQLLKGILN